MMLSAIIGDVVGSVYEFNNIRTKKFELVTRRSRFTNDSVMTLAVAHALCSFKKGALIDEQEFKQKVIASMKEFGRRYPRAGYGGRFRLWLAINNPEPYRSFGNGSAMRVSPVAWYFDDLGTVERFAKFSAEVTHNHPEGIKGAQATAAAIFMARTGKSKATIKNYIETRYDYDLDRTCDEIRPDYSFNESCQGTVPEDIIAFLEADDFEDALRTAVSLGGDTDTLAAITCSIAQGMWPVPEEIERRVRGCLDEFFISELEKWELSLSGE